MAYVKNTWVDQAGQIRYEQTTDEDDLIILTPNYELITEIGTPVNATNMNHIEDGIADCDTAIGQKVSKAGDTMSGGLTVSTNDTFIEGIKLKNTNIIAGNVPSTNSFTWLAFKDTNNVSVGGMYLRDTTNERELRLRVDSRNGNNDTFCIGYDANNKSYSTFPNTTCCDGQWVTKKLTVATEASSTSVATYSLSSYLPNDSYSYEVMLCFYFYDTGNTCGSCYFESDIFLTGNTNNSASQDVNDNLGRSFWFSQANTNARCISQVFTMPVGTGRYIKIKCTDANTQRYIYLAGYRRIGTNA